MVNENQNIIIEKISKLISKAKGLIYYNELLDNIELPFDQKHAILNHFLSNYKSRLVLDEISEECIVCFKFPLSKIENSMRNSSNWFMKNRFLRLFFINFKLVFGILMSVWGLLFSSVMSMIITESNHSIHRNKNKKNFDRIYGEINSSLIDPFRRASWNGGLKPNKFSNNNNFGGKFTNSVADFVFGPPRIKNTDMLEQRKILDFINQNNGLLTTIDIVELTGVSIIKAESILAEFCGKFSGVIGIDRGSLICKFNNNNKLLESLRPNKSIKFYSDEIEPPYELHGNTISQNLLIIVVDIGILITSIYLISIFKFDIDYHSSREYFFKLLHELGQGYPFVIWLFGYIPFAFSIIFMIIPFLRSLALPIQENKRRKNILKKKIMKVIFSNFGKPISEQKLFELVKSESKEIHQETLEVQKIIRDLGGIAQRTLDNETQYFFERISKELTTRSYKKSKTRKHV